MHPWESLHLCSRHCAAAPTPRPLQDKASVRARYERFQCWASESESGRLCSSWALCWPQGVKVRTSDFQ